MVAFSTCNKPFKPLGYPSGRVRSREGLQKIYPQNLNQKNQDRRGIKIKQKKEKTKHKSCKKKKNQQGELYTIESTKSP